MVDRGKIEEDTVYGSFVYQLGHKAFILEKWARPPHESIIMAYGEMVSLLVVTQSFLVRVQVCQSKPPITQWLECHSYKVEVPGSSPGWRKGKQ